MFTAPSLRHRRGACTALARRDARVAGSCAAGLGRRALGAYMSSRCVCAAAAECWCTDAALHSVCRIAADCEPTTAAAVVSTLARAGLSPQHPTTPCPRVCSARDPQTCRQLAPSARLAHLTATPCTETALRARAAWHDSGTYNKDTGEGGATGTIRFDKEITAAPNAGLNTAIKLVSKIKKDHPDVTWADLYQLGSAVSIEVRLVQTGLHPGLQD